MEKYGTIPPRFTKEWWEHYWTYYKFHFLGGIFLLTIISSIIYSIATKINYDLTVHYITAEALIDDEKLSRLENHIAELSSDVTQNGKTEILVQMSTGLNADNMEAIQFNTATTTKLVGDMQTGSTQLYIVNKQYADRLISYECLLSVSDWADTYPEGSLYHETVLSLSGNKQLEALGFDTNDLYLGVFNPREGLKKDPEYVDKFENAVTVAGNLIKE